jgi:hypothetical protein
MDTWLQRVGEWREFYVFTGTAAATLMGLMFVVMSLTQQTLASRRAEGAVSAFFTPIVAFFATEMVVSMLVLIPAITPQWLGIGLVIVGVVGSAYMLVRGFHARWRRRWDLDVDDWIWYFLLPAASYGVVIVGGVYVWHASAYGVYGVAVVMGALLLIGVRNAWDLVVYTLLRPPGSDTAAPGK